MARSSRRGRWGGVRFDPKQIEVTKQQLVDGTYQLPSPMAVATVMLDDPRFHKSMVRVGSRTMPLRIRCSHCRLVRDHSEFGADLNKQNMKASWCSPCKRGEKPVGGTPDEFWLWLATVLEHRPRGGP